MAKYNTDTGEIDMEGVDPESIYGQSLWIHENVHKGQHEKYGFSYKTRYMINPWKFERPAYFAQISFLKGSGERQDRFTWLRDILEVGYRGVTPEKVEDLLNELEL